MKEANVMDLERKKKVLFVTDREFEPEDLTKSINHIINHLDPEDLMILNTYGQGIFQPYGDVIRDMIIAVYQENIEEIVVVAAKNNQLSAGEILSMADKNKELQEKLETLDYLFNNCKPEFPGFSASEWLEGTKTAAEIVQKNINTIRNHPLMPEDIKIHGISINTETKQLVEI
jgi:carbonic anhydrase